MEPKRVLSGVAFLILNPDLEYFDVQRGDDDWTNSLDTQQEKDEIPNDNILGKWISIKVKNLTLPLMHINITPLRHTHTHSLTHSLTPPSRPGHAGATGAGKCPRGEK